MEEYTEQEPVEQPEQGPTPIRQGEQIEVSEAERKRLASRIEEDFRGAISDHDKRQRRNAYFYNLWRSRIGAPGGEKGKSNFKVPLVEWQVMGKLAKEIDALLGDDSEIIAKPVGPTDQESTPKVGLYTTWRMFDSMKITSSLIEFDFYKLMYGRAHAYAPFGRIEYEDETGQLICDYEGPQFFPLRSEDFIVPPEEVQSLHKFSWVIRRYNETPDGLLLGEEQNIYQGITDDDETWRKIVQAARDGQRRDYETDQQKEAQDHYEGVNRNNPQTQGECLEVWEWYGKWRMLKNPRSKVDVDETAFAERERQTTELVVRYVPALKQIISVQKLRALYPKKRNPRPFVECALMKTGEYWCKGIPEMVESIEAELTANSNLAADAGEFSVGPLIAVRSASGAAKQLEATKYEPFTKIETEEPQRDINPVYMKADLNYPILQEQRILSYAERVTGLSDQSLGRSIDRPNAPKTARGQILLDENANIRLSLDIRVLREDFSAIAAHIWELDSLYSPPEVFFRVAEDKAEGLFDTQNGFGKMTAKERGGRYDFDIRFATSAYSREAEKERALMLTQTALSVPIVANDARAQWFLMNDLFKKFGNDHFKKFVPKPPEMDLPREAKEEYTRALQGMEIRVHPVDQDDAHIAEHQMQIGECTDPDAKMRLIAHVLEHQQQKAKKLAYAAQVGMQMAAANALGAAPAPEQQPQQDPLAAMMGGGGILQ